MKRPAGEVNDHPKFTASLLETYPNLDSDTKPDDANVLQAKRWVEENEL